MNTLKLKHKIFSVKSIHSSARKAEKHASKQPNLTNGEKLQKSNGPRNTENHNLYSKQCKSNINNIDFYSKNLALMNLRDDN